MDTDTPTPESLYSQLMRKFVADPEISELDEKYLPFLELHNIDDISAVFDVIQNPTGQLPAGKLIWITELNLPLDLKKDVICVFERHFNG